MVLMSVPRSRNGRRARLAATAIAFALAASLACGAPPGTPENACLDRSGPGSGQGFIAAVARNAPAVVNVIVVRERGEPFDEPDADFFLSSVAGLPLPDRLPAERAVSSGFIISSDGQILTSAHAVLRAQEIWVRTADGMRLPARVVGLDRRTDVALLQVEARGLPVVPLVTGTRLCAGEWVAAIGTPFGFENSVTAGVVSAYPRHVPGAAGLPLIQTDAAINPGSSGGPLFNAAGVVVGMNSMIFSALGGSVGLSFALPIDRVMRVAHALRAGGTPRADIGIRTQHMTAELASAFGLDSGGGALVSRVEPGSAAAAAGLRAGDIVLAVNAAAHRLAAGDRGGHRLRAHRRAHRPGYLAAEGIRARRGRATREGRCLSGRTRIRAAEWRRAPPGAGACRAQGHGGPARRRVRVHGRRLGAACGPRGGRPHRGGERRRGRRHPPSSTLPSSAPPRARIVAILVMRGGRCHLPARAAPRRLTVGAPTLTCVMEFGGCAPRVKSSHRNGGHAAAATGRELRTVIPSVRCTR